MLMLKERSAATPWRCAMSDGVKALLGLAMFEQQFGFNGHRWISTDNKSQIAIAAGSTPKKSAHQPWRTRHVQAVVHAGLARPAWIATLCNPADIGTKIIRSRKQFEFIRSLSIVTDSK